MLGLQLGLNLGAGALLAGGGAPPVIEGQISPAFLSSQTAFFIPTLSFGAITVSASLLASAGQIFAPTVLPGAITVSPNLLVAGGAIYSPTVSVASSYDSDAVAYFTATGITDATRKGHLNTLVVGLKADGLWTKIDWLLVAGATSLEMRTNVRAPSKVASAINSPTYTTDRGFTGDGSTSYLDIGEVYNNTGNQWSQNSATIGVWCNLEAGATGIQPHCGNTGADRNVIRARNTAGNESFNINDSTASILRANAGSRTGHRAASRNSSTDKRGYVGGSLVTTLSVSSSSVSATNGTVLRGGSVYTSDRISGFYSASDFSDADHTAMHSRLNTYLTAIGAN